jgi:AraC family transcriptional regulator
MIRDMRLPIVDVQPLRLACVRHLGPYEEIVEAFARLMSLVDPAIIAPDKYPRYVAIYYDDPQQIAAESLRSDAAVVVGPQFSAVDGLHVEELSDGSYARYTHIGPYSDIGSAWQKFMAQLEEEGCEVQPAPVFEMYLNDPDEVPADYLATDLFVKVASP